MKILKAILAALLLACGGYAEDLEQETETTTQDVVVDTQHGFRTDTGSSETRCIAASTSSPGQVCMLPSSKTMTVRILATGFTAQEKLDAEGQADGNITSWSNDWPSGWSYSRITSGDATVNIQGGTLPGNNKNAIHTYARVTTVTGTTAINDQGRPGTWNLFTRVTCTIDRNKINVDFLPAQRLKVQSHAVSYCMLKAAGLGSGGPVNRAYAIGVTPDSVKHHDFGNAPKCWLANYDPSNTGALVYLEDLMSLDPCAGALDN